MHLQKSKKIFIYFFLFLIFGTINNKNINNIKIKELSKIYIQGLDTESELILENNLKRLKIKNLFFLDKYEIEKTIKSNDLVEKFSVFKNYPYNLIVKIDKTKFLARVKKNSDNFFLGSNGRLIKTSVLDDNLPFIYGNFINKNFFELKRAIDDSDLNYNTIDEFFSFKSGRWDIKTKNGILIKLPRDDLKKNIDLSIKLLSEDNEKKIKEIDLRQKNQIIING